MCNSVELEMVNENDAKDMHTLQIKAFSPLYEKYKDDATSPAKESIEKLKYKIIEDTSDFYFILHEGIKVGGVRVKWKQNKRVYKNILWISPIFVIPKWQNRGISTIVMQKLFTMYPNIKVWRLDTIMQEKGNCHFYEKLGFVKTGKPIIVNNKMTLISYKRLISE